MTFLPLAITTATNPSAEMEDRSQLLAAELNAPYTPRRTVSVAQIFQETGAARLLVVEKNRLLLRAHDGAEYFFHPNMALVRGMNMLRGGHDLFEEATGLGPGDGLLDCTLGFASEATLSALLVGESGRIVGLESVPELAAVTRAGVAQFVLQTRRIADAMRRVRVVSADYRHYLPHCESDAFDVVYFDPFFGERLPGSEHSVSPLFHFGDHAPLDADSLREARRVARRRVVVKHPRHEPLPTEIALETDSVVTTRKNRVQYDIFTAL
jgi:16S rRNA (guanine1516-N2)-methyltransferase